MVVTVISLLHIAVSCARGGRLRHFLWPFGHPFWLVRRLREGGLYSETRDALWAFVASLRVPYFFRLGLGRILGHPRLARRAGDPDRGHGRFPVLGLLGALHSGGDRAVFAFLASPLRGRGAMFRPCFPGGPSAIDSAAHPGPLPFRSWSC